MLPRSLGSVAKYVFTRSARGAACVRYVHSPGEPLKPLGVLRSQLIVVALAVGSLLLAMPGPGSAQGAWTATSTTNAPTVRWGPTVVWTGSKMVAWGGSTWGNAPLDTGGIYDPATDTWTATSTTNAPAARVYHTAVWTGSKMIVWGGAQLGGVYLNTGGIYDPATDTWTATSMTNAPTARFQPAAVWTGSKMIVWGGSQGLAGYTNTGGIYDPVTDSWTATSTTNAPTGRASHTAVWTGSKMTVWGGQQDVTFNYVNSGGTYDPAANTWTATSTTNAAAARGSHTAVWTGSKMIVWGGWDGINPDVNTGGIYDPATNTWTATSTTNAPSGREDHRAVWTGSKMTVWGGWANGPLNTGGIYDPASDTWAATSTTNAPTARHLHAVVWTGSKMIVWGGNVSAAPTGGPALAADSTRSFPITGGVCGIPSTANAVSVNLTAVQAAAAGHLTLYPGNAVSSPLVSTINFSPGVTRANNAIVLLATDGIGTIKVKNGSAGAVHFVLDVNGYFQ